MGIAPNKLLAKMASDFEKPNKVHTLYKEEIADKIKVTKGNGMCLHSGVFYAMKRSERE